MNEFDTKRDGIPVRIVETGEEFNSIQACANRLNVDAKWLGKVVRGETGFNTCHGYHIVVSGGQYSSNPPPDVIGRPGQRIWVLESGEEFQSARECARNIEGDHKSVLRAARNNREYKERHFKLIT